MHKRQDHEFMRLMRCGTHAESWKKQKRVFSQIFRFCTVRGSGVPENSRGSNTYSLDGVMRG